MGGNSFAYESLLDKGAGGPRIESLYYGRRVHSTRDALVNYPALKGEASTLRGFPEETLQRFSF